MTLPDGTLIEYVHDPLGRRIAKKINGTVVEKYLWEGLTRLLAVYNADNTLKMRFEYADARMPVAMTAGGVKYYLAYDQTGTLKAVADPSGTVVKRIEYDTFGNIINDTAPAFAVPFGFAGGLYDRDTGLVRFGYRDYDPETGRWTAKDPILFAGGDTDLYGYCLNDPVNLIDPYGLFDCKKEFFNQLLEPVTKVANQYNFDPNYLLAISAHESGWLGPHAYELNNAFGMTKAGGKNLEFNSFSESVDYWGKTFGSKVSGATSINDFINKLQTDLRSRGGLGKYNSRDERYEDHIKDAYKSVSKRRGSPCECE